MSSPVGSSPKSIERKPEPITRAIETAEDPRVSEQLLRSALKWDPDAGSFLTTTEAMKAASGVSKEIDALLREQINPHRAAVSAKRAHIARLQEKLKLKETPVGELGALQEELAAVIEELVPAKKRAQEFEGCVRGHVFLMMQTHAKLLENKDGGWLYPLGTAAHALSQQLAACGQYDQSIVLTEFHMKCGRLSVIDFIHIAEKLILAGRPCVAIEYLKKLPDKARRWQQELNADPVYRSRSVGAIAKACIAMGDYAGALKIVSDERGDEGGWAPGVVAICNHYLAQAAKNETERELHRARSDAALAVLSARVGWGEEGIEYIEALFVMGRLDQGFNCIREKLQPHHDPLPPFTMLSSERRKEILSNPRWQECAAPGCPNPAHRFMDLHTITTQFALPVLREPRFAISSVQEVLAAAREAAQ